MADLGTQLRRRAGHGGTAVRCGEQVVGYRELDARADAWAAFLRARLAPGQRVATLCRAGIEQIALLYGCARAGMVLAPLPHRLRPAELAVLLDDATPAMLLTDPAHRQAASAALAQATHRTPVAPLTTPPAAPRVDAEPDPDAPVLLCYTSGSAGRPRGVPLSGRMCTATDDALDGVARLTPDDVVLQLLPQYHVGGWTVLPLLALARGATLVLVPEFDATRVLGLIAAHRASVTMAVPAMYRMMLAAAAGAELSSLRLAISGGAALPAELARSWWALGVPLCQGYGLTEAGPNVLCVPPAEVHSSAGFVGVPYPGVEVTLTGVPDGPGRGELLVRGAGVFAGYWRGPRHRGWLHTGDLAERDRRGWYRIVGRLDDRYVAGGENVHPAEVERVLLAHPAVRDAAVVDVPDERWGAVGVAFVVASDELKPAAVRDWCRHRIAGFKVPARVLMVPELPRTGIGKPCRNLLRDWAMRGQP
ncbi:long-chain-fatty-acid--CoA ligase [Actinocatenispora thailandica]|uniref:Long-chain-fatty-acid--CoA ligase n=1 Tax=Actinocatenispora thailandica TaxID=227318 RepID=A0A7R7HZQ8_9ACTN|nr:class I adenylate-forming enzyme family protein [Actinocatenispora thailandica]BCJ37298.1 long-chain-fatty-acid--CoA ligase [Actinocatenispora thailandica]